MAGVQLTPYGGVGEIGGNAFVLDDGGSRILLDFGKRFGGTSIDADVTRSPGWGDYYDLLMKPRGGHQVYDLMALGLLPPMPGAYRDDLGPLPTTHSHTKSPFDLLLVSHPHADHYGMMGYLRNDTPVAMSDLSRLTLESVQKTGTKLPDDSFVRYKSPGAPEHKTNKSRSADEVLALMPERSITTVDRLDVGDWDIERFPVDHSIHGAAAYILQHRKGGPTIAYSGDLRLHGRHPEKTQRFLDAMRGADIVIIEGTRVGHGHRPGHGDGAAGGHGDDASGARAGKAGGGRDGTSLVDGDGGEADTGGRGGSSRDDGVARTEADVERHVAEVLTGKLVATGTGFAAIAYPPRDLDRLTSILRAAIRAGRILVITEKQAHLLRVLHNAGHVSELADPLVNPALRVLVDDDDGAQPAPAAGPTPDDAGRSGEGSWAVWTRDVKELGRRIRAHGRTVTLQEIRKEPRAYLVTMSSFTLNLLPGLLAPDRPDNGVFIHSQTQPFNDEGILRDFRLNRWLARFGLKEYDTHVSGHISQQALFHALDEWTNKTLVPIHTEFPQMTRDQFERRAGRRVLMPVFGAALQL